MATNNVREIIDGVDYRWVCNETLVNRMQCKRPANWIVLDENGEDTNFQMCNRCKVLSDAGITNAPILPVTGTGTIEAQLPSSPVVQTVVDSENSEGVKKENGTDPGATDNSNSALSI